MYTIYPTKRTLHGIAAVRLLTMLGVSLATAVSTMGQVHKAGVGHLQLDVDGLDIVLAPMGYRVVKEQRRPAATIAQLYAHV